MDDYSPICQGPMKKSIASGSQILIWPTCVIANAPFKFTGGAWDMWTILLTWSNFNLIMDK